MEGEVRYYKPRSVHQVDLVIVDFSGGNERGMSQLGVNCPESVRGDDDTRIGVLSAIFVNQTPL